MIESMKIANYRKKTKTFELSEISDEGIYITDIKGLGLVKAKLNTTDIAGMDGSEYNSSQLEERNIVITFKMEAVYGNSVEDARQLLYELFTTKREVELTFKTTNRYASCVGYVESNEPDIFQPEVSQQISIICPDPCFYDANDTGLQVTTFFGIQDNFEFPFMNDSLIEDELEFGIIRRNTSGNLRYEGEVETGCKIYIHAIGEVGTVTIYNTSTKERMVIDADKLAALTGSALKNADTIIIDTNRGSKGIKLLRDGEYTNVLNVISRDSAWFTLSQGDNLFAYTATHHLYNLQFQIENRIAYGGI